MIATLALLTALQSSPPPQADPAAAYAIFDGTSLAGWSGDERYWSVREGCIVGESSAENPLEQTTYLVWQGGSVGDFELELEFRIRGGNSGIQFRSRLVGEHAVAGYQADMEDGPSWTGGLYEQDGRGVVARRGQAVVLAAAGDSARELGDADALQAAIHAGDWNRYRIRALGRQIDLWVNGLHTCSITDEDPRASASGILALQLHAGPAMRVDYRGLRLTELAPVPEEAAAARTSSERTCWIWPTRAITDWQEAWLRKAFRCTGKVVRARLRGACDNRANVYLNGELVAASAAWWSPYEVDVTEELREGENLLAAWGQNEKSTAGFWLELELESEDGPAFVLRSDASWQASSVEHGGFEQPGFDASAWQAAVVVGRMGDAPWGLPGQPSSYERSEALPATELELPPGFRAELLHSVAREREGSWVALAADDGGRLYASDQYGALYAIEPAPLDGSGPTRVERLPVALGEAQGLAWANGMLYAVVNGHGHYASGLWRVRDANGDGRLDTPELLTPLEGGGEHGPHGLRLAPDGRSLYVMAGNHTRLPEALAASRVPRNWGEDLLLPRIEDPNGHAAGILAPGGWICRTDLDGKSWELVAAGMRNPYDFDYDEEGELFTFDADMEWDVGLPWYRPTRILHLVSGADYGWRNGSGKWPSAYPDSWPAVVDVGLASPTGVEMGWRTSFPEPWRSALYVCDWAYGTLYAVHLEPAGASYRGRVEVFARGKPFPLTDACVAPDGALYLTTGGRQTQSGLYRIRALEPAAAGARAEAQSDRAARSERRSLESSHAEGAAVQMERALALLASHDRYLRQAARLALEHAPVEQWGRRALALADPRAAVETLVALARQEGGASGAELLARFEALPRSFLGGEEAAGALRALELVLIRKGEPQGSERERLLGLLEALYPSGNRAADRELCALLVRLGSPAILAKGLEAIDGDLQPEERVHILYCLRLLIGRATAAELERYFEALTSARENLEGGHSFTLYLDRIREEAYERLTAEQVAALALRASPRESSAGGASTLLAAAFVRAWTPHELERLLAESPLERAGEAGAAAFEKASCQTCHRFAGHGGSTGPDLSGVASRFNRRDLLEAICEPSKVVSDQYRDSELVTRDDRVLVGRIEREENGWIHLRALPPREELVLVPAEEVAERRLHALSRMPSGLLDCLTESEIRALFAFLEDGGASSPDGGAHEDR